MGLIPGSGRSPGVGHGNPLQYSCLENHIEELGGLQSVGLQWAMEQVMRPSTVLHSAHLTGRLSGTVSPFRAEQGTSLETPSRARVGGSAGDVLSPRTLCWRGPPEEPQHLFIHSLQLGLWRLLEPQLKAHRLGPQHLEVGAMRHGQSWGHSGSRGLPLPACVHLCVHLHCLAFPTLALTFQYAFFNG